MKKLSVLLSLILLAAFSVPAYAAEVDDSVWERIEESYYTSPIASLSEIENYSPPEEDDSAPSSEETSGESGDQDGLLLTGVDKSDLDPDRIAAQYDTIVNSSENWEENKQNALDYCQKLLNGEKLSDLLSEPTMAIAGLTWDGKKRNDGFATLMKSENGAWRIQSGTVLEETERTNVNTDLLIFTGELKDILISSGLNLANTTAKSVFFESNGILFSDGEKEFYWATLAYGSYGTIDAGVLYTPQELARIVTENIDLFYQKPNPDPNYIPNTGGAGAGPAPSAKANPSTGNSLPLAAALPPVCLISLLLTFPRRENNREV